MKITSVVFIIFLLCSCHAKRLAVSNFMSIDDFSELNGRYINDENRLSSAFNIYNNEEDISTMELDFKTADSLIVSYTDVDGYKEMRLKGKRKKNFFEIYFSNTRIYLPPILLINNIDRLRIGKDKEEKLLIYCWEEGYGMIMPLGAGGSADDEYQQTFSRYDKNTKSHKNIRSCISMK